MNRKGGSASTGIVLALLLSGCALVLFTAYAVQASPFDAAIIWTQDLLSHICEITGLNDGVGTEKPMLVKPDEVENTDVILDVSDGADAYIPGAVHIDYSVLSGENKTLKPPDELAGIFGGSGISDKDSVVIYGECEPCGGSGVTLHPSTYTYFALLSLGHQNLRLLDGGMEAWLAAGKPTTGNLSSRLAVRYIPRPRQDLQASVSYIKENPVQLVDARTMREYEVSTIPGSVNIPAERVAVNGSIRDDAELEMLFKELSKDRPVVVYTSTGLKGSVVWFALEKMGYKAKLFVLGEWARDNQPLVEPSL